MEAPCDAGRATYTPGYLAMIFLGCTEYLAPVTRTGSGCAFCGAAGSLVDSCVVEDKWSRAFGGAPVVALDHGWYTSATGERVPAAALREVAEETGFGAGAIEAFYDLDQVAPFYDEGSDAVVVSAIFAVRVRPEAEPVLSREHDAHRWVTPDEALRLAIWPSYAESIRRIREQLLDTELAPWFEMTLAGERKAR